MSTGTTSNDATGQPSSAGEIEQTAGRYLLAIHRISDDEGSRVSTGELRERLDVSPSSVTEMVGKLDDRGLVDYEKYRGVRLTERGADVATGLAWRLCVVTNFFGSTLDTDLDDRTSYEIGFTLPADGVSRLRELVNHPCRESCPETDREYDECLA